MTLTIDRLKELVSYDPETGVFIRKVRLCNRTKVGDVAGSTDSYGYRILVVDGKKYKAHRLAWFYEYGRWPNGMIDHINCNPSDNRIKNLRECNMSGNKQNRVVPQKNCGSKLLGVYKNKKTWFSRIQLNNVSYYIGTFKTKEEAHQAYIDAKRKLHEYCTL